MRRATVIVTFVGVACMAVGQNKDPIKENLFEAKVAYDKQMRQFRKQAAEWFDKREETARKAGDKKTLDQIKAERAAFDEYGGLPRIAPTALQEQPAHAKKTLEAAYADAVKAYTKVRKDDEAAAVEKEWNSFRARTELQAVNERVQRAKDAYEKTIAEVEKFVLAALDKAENDARKRGDKDAISRIKFDRQMFEIAGILPKSAQPALTQTVLPKVTAAWKSLSDAYAFAIQAYTKAGEKAEVAATEKAWNELKQSPGLRKRYVTIANKNSELLMAPKSDKGDEGSEFHQAKPTGGNNQLWTLRATDTPDVYLLQNKASGHYASIGGSTNAGQNLALSKDQGNGSRWLFVRDGNEFLLQNVHSKMYAAVGEASKDAGARVLQWHRVGDEQLWRLVPAK